MYLGHAQIDVIDLEKNDEINQTGDGVVRPGVFFNVVLNTKTLMCPVHPSVSPSRAIAIRKMDLAVVCEPRLPGNHVGPTEVKRRVRGVSRNM